MSGEARRLKVAPMIRPVHRLRAPNITWCEKRVRSNSRLILATAEDPATCPLCRDQAQKAYLDELKRQAQLYLEREARAKAAYDVFTAHAGVPDLGPWANLPPAVQAGWCGVVEHLRDELEDEEYAKFEARMERPGRPRA